MSKAGCDSVAGNAEPSAAYQLLLGVVRVPIRTVSFFTYRTHGWNWSPAEIAVLRFVRALKGELVGDRRDVLVNGDPRSLGDENADEALGWFAEMAVDVLEDELGTTAVVLAPVPDSASALSAEKCRTVWLADAVALRSSAVVLDALRWNVPKPKAHEGGPRAASELLSRLRLRRPITDLGQPFVLIDDLTTGGGHVQASAALLRNAGANVVLAVCGAQADSVPQEDPFRRRVVEWPDIAV
jgi:hypothetical protein